MLIALEGPAGTGKSTLRDHLLTNLSHNTIVHFGQFSWLSLPATRILVALRAGHPRIDEKTAVAAALDDLALHHRHNLAPAARIGHVLADRHVMSTACLLALTYQRPVETYLTALAADPAVQPRLTILLTTPADACRNRLACRPTAHRLIDDPALAAELHQLYQQAGNHWAHLTGRPLWRRSLLTPADTRHTVTDIVAYLRSTLPGGSR
ncbi:AAA family ATPase [Nocardia sp. CDC159]|uniref:AAA family ATPase n=1 Tax=Nocardia pulmonis TaxID=2951408 RepID=A0A9X2E559_9NOCA|nr:MULTISPECIES: AAA family ATPase [Nocardia]MCM6774507.1 AAA family ATPase [Nocardia pulmonis]MCM6787427.1 AAA family ATPase [Nocardia sp. CDC159]